MVAMTVIVFVSLFTDPRPGLHGDGPLVALAVVALVAGILLSVPRADIPPRRRLAGLPLVAAATWALTALQPVGVVFGALYYVVVISALRLELRAGADRERRRRRRRVRRDRPDGRRPRQAGSSGPRSRSSRGSS